MKKDLVVLIVTSRFGDGHMKAAEAIEHAFQAQGVHSVYIRDLFAETHPRVNRLSRTFYLNRAPLAKEFYGLLYKMTRSMKPGHLVGNWLHSMGKRKVRQVLDELRPDLILHTFPYLAAAQLGERTGSRAPVFTVVTDYVLHGRWLHPHTTKYFVATEAMKASLLSAGISEEALVVSGIPVRHPFEQSLDREELVLRYGLRVNRRYFLLVAGAYGVLSDINRLIQQVLDQSELDVITVCGHNRKVQQAVLAQFHGSHRVHILGYTENMHELMAIADCLLTKAGGITLTEAVARRVPVIVYRPSPGQEAGNAAELAREGVVEVAYNEGQVIDQLQRLVDDKEYRQNRIDGMDRFSKRASSALIVAETLEEIERGRSQGDQAGAKVSEWRRKKIHGYI